MNIGFNNFNDINSIIDKFLKIESYFKQTKKNPQDQDTIESEKIKKFLKKFKNYINIHGTTSNKISKIKSFIQRNKTLNNQEAYNKLWNEIDFICIKTLLNLQNSSKQIPSKFSLKSNNLSQSEHHSRILRFKIKLFDDLKLHDLKNETKEASKLAFSWLISDNPLNQEAFENIKPIILKENIYNMIEIAIDVAGQNNKTSQSKVKAIFELLLKEEIDFKTTYILKLSLACCKFDNCVSNSIVNQSLNYLLKYDLDFTLLLAVRCADSLIEENIDLVLQAYKTYLISKPEYATKLFIYCEKKAINNKDIKIQEFFQKINEKILLENTIYKKQNNEINNFVELFNNTSGLQIVSLPNNNSKI